MVQVTVDATDTVERAADDRGRVRLGPEYAGKTVQVAVLDADDEQSDN